MINLTDDKKETFATLSERLVYILTQLGITKAELARKIKVTPQTIQYLCTSRAKKSNFTFEIADALGISPTWLSSGEGPIKFEDNENVQLIDSFSKIPILNRSEVFSWLHGNNLESTSNEWVLTNSLIGEKGFAIRLNDKSMYPRLDQNTIIILNTDKIPKNKEFVLAYIKSIDDIIFRQYEIQDESEYLVPLNTSLFKIIPLEKDDKILGVMVEARWQL